MGGDRGTDVVLLDVSRVRDERLNAVPAGKRDEDLGRRAEIDEALDRRRYAVLARGRGRLDPHALRADGESNHAGARLPLGRGERHTSDVDEPTVDDAPAHEVRHAEEVRDERGLRMLVDVARRTELLDSPARHHGEPVGHRQRLLLVVRDVEESDPDLALDRLELDLELAAELCVERAERLVQEEDGRREHERTSERDALLLPTGELVRTSLPEAAEPHELEGLGDPAALLVLRRHP